MLEIIGVIGIALFAYVLTLSENSIQEELPMLGALTLAAQRLLPALQMSYSAFTSIKAQRAVMKDVIRLLSQPLVENSANQSASPLPFENEISLVDLSFKYPDQEKWIIKNLNITLKRNTTIGFVGTTGAGKSTLIKNYYGISETHS